MSHAQAVLAFDARRRRIEQSREAEVLHACLELLALRGIPAWRANTGAARLRNANGAERFVRFGTKGQSDILGMIPPYGRLLAVETKAHGRKATADQIAFLDAVNRAGGIGIVVYDVRELDAALPDVSRPRSEPKEHDR